MIPSSDPIRHARSTVCLLFHDLRRSGARNYRRAQVTEDVIMRIGGWKTPSMFRRYNVVDERDLTEAGERLAGFLTDATSAPTTILPLAPVRAARSGGRIQKSSRERERGQNTDNRGTSAVAQPDSAVVSSSIPYTEKEGARWPHRSSKPRCPAWCGMEGSTPSLLRQL